jgi:hypothetical protein
MRTILLTIGTLLPLIGAALYAASIFKGKTMPQRTTRFLLALVTAITLGSLWAQNDTSGVWLALASFIEATVILVLSFKYGMGGKDRLDFVCIAICLVGVTLWLSSGRPWIGLIASIAADLVASAPSFIKTVRFPHTEFGLFYALGVVSGLAIVFAGPFTLEAVIFPAYIISIDLAYTVVIWWPRKGVVTEVPEAAPVD